MSSIILKGEVTRLKALNNYVLASKGLYLTTSMLEKYIENKIVKKSLYTAEETVVEIKAYISFIGAEELDDKRVSTSKYIIAVEREKYLGTSVKAIAIMMNKILERGEDLFVSLNLHYQAL